MQPTYYDPCSLVVLEALACGLPVITTAQNGASELMTDGREGYILTAPDAQDELIAALDHMTDDTSTASDVGAGVAARPVADVRCARRAVGRDLRGSRRREIAALASLSQARLEEFIASF